MFVWVAIELVFGNYFSYLKSKYLALNIHCIPIAYEIQKEFASLAVFLRNFSVILMRL